MYVQIDIDTDKILLTLIVEFMVSILVVDLAEGKSWAGSRLEQGRRNRIYFQKQKEGFFAVEDFHTTPHTPSIAPTPPPSPQAKPSSATKENSDVCELAEFYPCFGRTSYCSEQWISSTRRAAAQCRATPAPVCK